MVKMKYCDMVQIKCCDMVQMKYCDMVQMKYCDMVQIKCCDMVQMRTPFMSMCTRYNIMGTPVSSTNRTDRHDIIEVLLKMVLNTITLTPMSFIYW
jgi:hypothetical protein